MKICVVSDSHQNIDYLQKAYDIAVNEKAEIFIHLGDDYDDMDRINQQDIELLRIPGVYSSYYRRPDIPNRMIKEFSGWKFLLTHAPTAHENDQPPNGGPAAIARKENVQLVLHGHTHIPGISEIEGILWVNPGHLKINDKKGHPASLAIIEAEDDKITVTIRELLTGTEITKREMHRPGKLNQA